MALRQWQLQAYDWQQRIFINLQPCSLESVKFGDGAKGTILRSGSLKIPCMLKIEHVLLVNELKVNLIIISQLCNHNLFVHFTKDNCSITNNSNLCYGRRKVIRQLLSIDFF